MYHKYCIFLVLIDRYKTGISYQSVPIFYDRPVCLSKASGDGLKRGIFGFVLWIAVSGELFLTLYSVI